jgi:GNAT superfamily N-acetyltransferase
MTGGNRDAGHVRELRDGSRVRIRPIAPSDRAALAAGFARLSPESRFRRFLSPKKELSEQDLDELTQIDHHDHEALVALEAATDEGLGVARFVRTGADRAEPAVAVADDWQGRGLGTLLIDALAERAYAEGVRTFRATVLATNARAIGLLEALGETTVTRAGTEVVVDVAVPEPPGAGQRLRRLLREFAHGTLAPGQRLLGRVSGAEAGGEPERRSGEESDRGSGAAPDPPDAGER